MEKIDAIWEVSDILGFYILLRFSLYILKYKHKDNLSKIQKLKISNTSKIASIYSMMGSKSTVTFRKIHIFWWN